MYRDELIMKPVIIIQPILFQLAGDLASLSEQHISKEFDALVKITSPLNDNQLPLIHKNRRQWKSDNILLWLQDINKPDRGNKLLAICDFDAYSGGLLYLGKPKLMVEYQLFIYQDCDKNSTAWILTSLCSIKE